MKWLLQNWQRKQRTARGEVQQSDELQDSHRPGDQTELCSSDPVPGLDQQQQQSSVAQVGVAGPKESGCSSCVEEFEGQSRCLLAGGLNSQSSPAGHHHHCCPTTIIAPEHDISDQRLLESRVERLHEYCCPVVFATIEAILLYSCHSQTVTIAILLTRSPARTVA